MAISSTINKVSLNIADMDLHYYQSHELTVAQHPSENDFRFMIRLIAFMANASEQLCFTRGLDSDDEPELWQRLSQMTLSYGLIWDNPMKKESVKRVGVPNK
jgi:uncharacterized protein YaeQ